MTDGAAKRAMREAVLSARRALPAAERAAHSARIADRVTSLEAFERARTIALYAPMGAEADPAEIARAAEARGKRVAYPRTPAGERPLTFSLASIAALVPGPFGTREPSASSPRIALSAIDLVLVPGVAFDLQCRRLGRGRGHYDATLAGLAAHAARIGLGFEVQLVPEVPCEPHDALLDAVVTEARVVFRLPSGAGTGRSSA